MSNESVGGDPEPPLSVDDVLGPGGRIARRLGDYEPRPQQIEMARKVAEALAGGQHLIAEAGTGTGKSFAYLVPAVLHVTDPRTRVPKNPDDPDDWESDEDARPRRVVVSTHTISLQEQLIAKDIPLVNAVTPREFSAVLVKGRGNYVSMRRLARATEKSASLIPDARGLSHLQTINRWAKNTTDGSLSSLPIRPSPAVWDEVASESSNCLGRRCKTYEQCHYFAARRRAASAQLLVVNHALFFTDLALRRQGVSILPDYDAAILDECHTIESVAGDHLGIRVTNGQVEFLLDRLYNDRSNKGLLVDHEMSALQKLVNQCRFAMSDLFSAILDHHERHAPSNGRVRKPNLTTDPLSPLLERLSRQLGEVAERTEAVEQKKDFQSASDRTLALAGSLRSWLGQQCEDESVYWIETTGNRRGGMDRVSLIASPINVGVALRRELFRQERIGSVILTSATLATGRDDRFRFYRGRIGLDDGMNIRVGSPFDYAKQAKLVVVGDMPDPKTQGDQFESAVATQVQRFVGHTEGHAFVLFTSFDLMRKVEASVGPWAAKEGLMIYSQAGEIGRTELLAAFQKNPRGMLLGADSFWQGVDVPGDDLRNVVITKLPFSVPTHPLRQARAEAIQASGGNSFGDYLLPEAIIKFRQGFGRLIRRRSDTGIVVVLDPRIVTKPYGRQFIAALPDVPVTRVSQQRRGR